MIFCFFQKRKKRKRNHGLTDIGSLSMIGYTDSLRGHRKQYLISYFQLASLARFVKKFIDFRYKDVKSANEFTQIGFLFCNFYFWDEKQIVNYEIRGLCFKIKLIFRNKILISFF